MTIPSLGMSSEQNLQGTGLHDDPLQDRQACSELSQGGWSNISPVRAIFVLSPPKTVTNLQPSPPPLHSLNDSNTFRYFDRKGPPQSSRRKKTPSTTMTIITTSAWLYVTIIDINTIILQYYSGYVRVGFWGGDCAW